VVIVGVTVEVFEARKHGVTEEAGDDPLRHLLDGVNPRGVTLQNVDTWEEHLTLKWKEKRHTIVIEKKGGERERKRKREGRGGEEERERGRERERLGDRESVTL
jgi:hypothetical protein